MTRAGITRASMRLSAAVLGVALAGVAVPATGTESTLVELDARLVQLAADAADEYQAELDVQTGVEVGGTLVELPAGLGPLPGRTGDPVELTVAVDEPAPVREILAELVAPDAIPTTTEIVSAVSSPSAAAATTDHAAAVTGTHVLTVLPVQWGGTDGQTQASLTALADTAGQYWSEQSGGRLQFGLDVRDWAQITDPGSCDAMALMAAAKAAHGVTTLAPGQHVVVYFPERSDCSWAGYASIGGSSIWLNGVVLADVLAHELGHNLGLGHANTVRCVTATGAVPLLVPFGSCQTTEYGDWADVMGIGMALTTGNLNTALADHLGWVVSSQPPLGATTTVTLAPLATTTALRAVRIPVSGGTLYVDYRPATGRDVRMPGWAGVQVHLQTVHPLYGYPTSYLVDMSAADAPTFTAPSLDVGQVWSVPGADQAVTLAAEGVTARVTVAPPSDVSEISDYVIRVYQDLFGRAPDTGGLSTWTMALTGGTPRVAVANAITGSTEYRSRLIQESYAHYLSRTAEPAGLTYWLAQMQVGRTISQMEAGFLASDEYFQRSGGSVAGWVSELYGHVLGRTPSASEVSYWVQQERYRGRFAVAEGFLVSTEHLTTVVAGYYQNLLGREIDPVGR